VKRTRRRIIYDEGIETTVATTGGDTNAAAAATITVFRRLEIGSIAAEDECK
jgi:hypothetical protein